MPLVALATLSLVADVARGQEHAERLRSPATVRGTVGGESHHSYAVRARQGQIMTVRISWRRERDPELSHNHAEFYVSDLPDFGGDGLVKFGKESERGRRWSGRVPRTGNYYIYVMAHPIARYTLRVTVR